MFFENCFPLVQHIYSKPTEQSSCLGEITSRRLLFYLGTIMKYFLVLSSVLCVVALLFIIEAESQINGSNEEKTSIQKDDEGEEALNDEALSDEDENCEDGDENCRVDREIKEEDGNETSSDSNVPSNGKNCREHSRNGKPRCHNDRHKNNRDFDNRCGGFDDGCRDCNSEYRVNEPCCYDGYNRENRRYWDRCRACGRHNDDCCGFPRNNDEFRRYMDDYEDCRGSSCNDCRRSNDCIKKCGEFTEVNHECRPQQNRFGCGNGCCNDFDIAMDWNNNCGSGTYDCKRHGRSDNVRKGDRNSRRFSPNQESNKNHRDTRRKTNVDSSTSSSEESNSGRADDSSNDGKNLNFFRMHRSSHDRTPGNKNGQ